MNDSPRLSPTLPSAPAPQALAAAPGLAGFVPSELVAALHGGHSCAMSRHDHQFENTDILVT